MEHRIATPADAAEHGGALTPVGWRDLRDWLSLIECRGLLQRINCPVDPDEEIAAITFMATRREDAPALLFESPLGNRTGAKEQGTLRLGGRTCA
jgi:hypothetical protein